MRNVHHASRLEAQMLRLTSAAVAGVFVLAVVNWTGWATGRSRLTRFLADWPVMTPWTAALVAAVGLAILLQSGRPPRTRVRIGRGVALAAGALAVVFLLEYVTGRSFGLDLLWFPDSVRTLHGTWPGRPSPQTSWAVVLLSVAVGLAREDRRWASPRGRSGSRAPSPWGRWLLEVTCSAPCRWSAARRQPEWGSQRPCVSSY